MYIFFFNDTATPETYTLPLHDALPICGRRLPRRRRPAGERRGGGRAAERGEGPARRGAPRGRGRAGDARRPARPDRKSTRLNSSHANISYAVFCLKKKNILLVRLIIIY